MAASPLRLYLCDDNPQYRALVKIVLEQAGHEVVGEAGDGQEAVDGAPAAAPDVILLDLNMPLMGGFEALPLLRRAVPSAKLIVLTTGQAPKERRRALDSGADGFIVKPHRITSLAADLQAALLGRD